MAYVDIDIEEYIDEISTSSLEQELEHRKGKSGAGAVLTTAQNGYDIEFLRVVNEIIEGGNVRQATKLLEKFLSSVST